MPRSGAGVYTLPAGNPVVTNTAIATAWANPTFSDLATEITNSLDRGGRGAMTAQFKAFDGNIGAPGIAFGTELTMGIWRASAAVAHFVVGGTNIMSWRADRAVAGQILEHSLADYFKTSGRKSWKIDTTGDLFNILPSASVDGEDWDSALGVSADPTSGIWAFKKAVRAGDGTEALPGLAFEQDTDSGIYRVGANTLAVALGGKIQAKFSYTVDAVNFPEFTGAATGDAPGIKAEGSDANVGLGIYTKGTGTLKLGTAGSVAQVEVIDVASANRTLRLKGSNGANPILTTSAGALQLESASGAVNINGALQEKKVAVAAADIDLSLGNVFTKTIAGNTTFTVSNVPATGTLVYFILDLTNGGSATVTWWAGMKWAAGAAPVLTAAGRDVLGFFSHDGGTTWTGVFSAKDAK